MSDGCRHRPREVEVRFWFVHEPGKEEWSSTQFWLCLRCAFVAARRFIREGYVPCVRGRPLWMPGSWFE